MTRYIPTSPFPQWTVTQVRVLLDNPDTPTSDLCVLLAACGPERTRRSVRSKRQTLGLPPVCDTPQQIAADKALNGWPVLRGTHEDRDAAFIRIAVREGLRLGLIRSCCTAKLLTTPNEVVSGAGSLLSSLAQISDTPHRQESTELA